MSVKVTWLLAVKNGMPYLPETLASIEAQTYPDWEVLAWDNGSDDGTIEELNRWIPSRLPGRVVVDQPMESLGACRAEMVRQCKTEFCACIDADDVNFPQRLETQVTFLLDHPEVAVVGSQVNRLDDSGIDHGLFWPLPILHDDIVHTMLHSNPIAQPSVLFRRKAILDVGNYCDVGQINVEDYDLWLRVATRYQLFNLSTALLKYRVHDKSTTQIAILQNKLTRAVDDRFYCRAPALFGCSRSEAVLLRGRRHRFAALVFYRIVKYLERTQSGSWIDKLRSASFIGAANHLISRHDRFSSLIMAILNPDRKALTQLLFRSGKKCLRSLGIHKSYLLVRGRKSTNHNDLPRD